MTMIHFPRNAGKSLVMHEILANELRSTQASAALEGKGVEVLTSGGVTIVRASDKVPAGQIWYDVIIKEGDPEAGEPCS